MQKLIFTILTFTALLLAGCGSDRGQINKSDLEDLIIESISGDQDANVKLQGLLSSEHINNMDYNQLFIDELNDGDKTYYSVILEYSDPRLNLFAIYDNDLNFYLLDKSLNGYLNSEWIENNEQKFVFLTENFLTKDVLNIDRLSIYEVYDRSASLVYRSLSRFVEINDTVYQTVELITEDFLLTKISWMKEIGRTSLIDTFYFNSNSKKYLSRVNRFENYVDQKIKNFIWIPTKPQVTEDFATVEGDTTTKEYRITIDRGWQKNPKYIEDRRLKQPLTGVKYSNVNLNSSFTVLQVPKGDDGEKYCPYILTETLKGDYQIRASAVFEVENNYHQIFEHTCGSTKYFLIFECPKSIYLENRKVFSDIINSFSIDC